MFIVSPMVAVIIHCASINVSISFGGVILSFETFYISIMMQILDIKILYTVFLND